MLEALKSEDEKHIKVHDDTYDECVRKQISMPFPLGMIIT